MRTIVAAMVWLMVTAPVSAQQVAAPVTVQAAPSKQTMPEDSVPEAERLSFLARYVEGDSSLRDRRWALNRALIFAAKKDQATLADRRERETAFYRREAGKIDVASLPKPAKPCDRRPEAGSPLPPCAEGTSSFDIGNLYEIAAEGARLEGDRPREIALREAAAIFMGGPAPHLTYWTELAERAADAGQDDTARRVCGYLHASQYRSTGADPFIAEKNCSATLALKAQRWGDWLAIRAPAFATTKPTDAEALLTYCIAFARTGSQKEALDSCDKASTAINAHGASLVEAAARPDSNTLAMQVSGTSSQRTSIIDELSSEAARQQARSGSRVPLAVVVADTWKAEQPRLNSAVLACRHTANTGSAIDQGCALPDNIVALKVTFRTRSEALSDLAQAFKGSAPLRAAPAPK